MATPRPAIANGMPGGGGATVRPPIAWRVASARVAPFLAQLVLCGALGYYTVFLRFMPYDDEGYLLIGTKLFNRGRRLYDEVATTFGPFPYLLRRLIHGTTGLPVTHDVGRSLCLAFWLATAVVAAWAVGRITRSPTARVATLAAVFCTLTMIAQGPGHPQDLSALLLAVALLLSTFADTPARLEVVAPALGLIAGLLLATKINLGIFLLMAGGATMIVHGPRGRGWSAFALLYALALLAAPLLLIRPRLLDPSYGVLAFIETLGLASVVALCLAGERPTFFSGRHMATVAAACAVALACSCGAIWLLGTSARGIVTGVFLNGPRLGTTYSVALELGSRGWWFPALSFGLVAGGAAYRRSRPATGASTFVSALARVVIGVGLLWVAIFARTRADYAPLVVAASPFAAFVLLPTIPGPGGRTCPGSRPHSPSRTFLAFVAVTEFLWVYPVAGDQVAFATFLGVAAAVVAVSDGCSALRGLEVGSRYGRARPDRPSRAVAVLVTLALLASTGSRLFESWYQYAHAESLGLPGARRVRVPPWHARDLRSVTHALRRRGATFLTLPGLYSFHLWTGIDPPTGLNISNWVCKLSEEEQGRVIAVASRDPNLGAVYSPEALDAWRSGVEPPEGVEEQPLVRYIRASFRPTATFGWYIVMER
jgi:hypothetical protein